MAGVAPTQRETTPVAAVVAAATAALGRPLETPTTEAVSPPALGEIIARLQVDGDLVRMPLLEDQGLGKEYITTGKRPRGKKERQRHPLTVLPAIVSVSYSRSI